MYIYVYISHFPYPFMHQQIHRLIPYFCEYVAVNMGVKASLPYGDFISCVYISESRCIVCGRVVLNFMKIPLLWFFGSGFQ